MLATAQPTRPSEAIVARLDPVARGERYLSLGPAGGAVWVDHPGQASAFASMREAMRMAARLPAGQRAFGRPRDAELRTH